MGRMFGALIVAGALVGAAVPAHAAAGPDVLVVDFDRILSSSAPAQSGTSQLRAKFDPQSASLRTSYTAAAQAYQTQAKAAKPGTAPSPALQQAAQRVEELQQQAQLLNRQINQAAAYVRQQIIDHARPIAEQIRAEHKAAVVISKESALANDPNADVTAALIQRLNSSFPQPGIIPPQQPAPAAPAR